ncbi:MAG: hypothetical protein ABSD49_01785 [Candidatus Bathyarchaeia archaeon]|jgi:hypothetical protein
MRQEIVRIIAEARNLAEKRSLVDTEAKYLAAIAELEKSEDSVSGKAELWTTRAEYLSFRSNFITDGETIETSRERKLDAIRLAWKAAKLGKEYESMLMPKVNNLVKTTILGLGCVIREDDSHVHIECPIKIRNMGAGQFGFSVAFFYEKATCSICGRDVVKDMDCPHIPGEEYDGERCLINPENLHFDHVAMTKRPKDSNTGITVLSIPKDEFYSDFTEEQIRKKKEFGLPLVCSLCKSEGIDPSEISVDKFFQMQGIDLG